MSKGDRSKLPKWAQSEFETLEMRNAELQAKVKEAVEGDPDNRLVQQTIGVGASLFGDELPLIGRYVTAKLGENIEDRAELRMSVKDDSQGKYFVEAMAVSASLVVVPQSSNVVRIYAERRY